MADLLIELFSEEIPARMQARAAENLKRLVTDGIVEAGLGYSGAAAFSTPRRLCLTVSDDGVGGVSEKEGFGIRGMRERVQASDGQLDITPNEPVGTRVAAAWACP